MLLSQCFTGCLPVADNQNYCSSLMWVGKSVLVLLLFCKAIKSIKSYICGGQDVVYVSTLLWRTMCLWVFLSYEPGVSHSHFNLMLMGQLHHVSDYCHPSYFFSNQSSPTTFFTPGITKLHHQHSIIRWLGKCQDSQIYSYTIHGRSNDQRMHTSSVWVRQ